MEFTNPQCKRVLCIRLDNMGDVIMTTPAFRALKKTFPKSILTLLTSFSGSSVAPFIPYLNDTIIYDAPWQKHDITGNFLDVIEKIKNKHFDTAIIFTNFSQSSFSEALLCYLAGIPTRIAYCRENPYKLLTHWIPDKEPLGVIKHGVKRHLDLVAVIGAIALDTRLSLSIKNNDYTSVVSLLQGKHIDINKPVICIHPGASDKKRQYSIEFFATIAKTLIKQGFQIISTGTKKEKFLLSYIQKSCGEKIIIQDNLSTGQLIALIFISDLLISNNTGPVHIAAAMQTPVISFYAQTNPEHTPWEVPHKTFYFSVPNESKSNNEILKTIFYPTPESFDLKDVLDAVCNLLPLKRKEVLFTQKTTRAL